MRHTKYIFIIAVALSSCSLLDPDPQIITSDTYYKNEKEVQYGLAGVYGAMSSAEFYGNLYSLLYSNTDDLCYINRKISSSDMIEYNMHNASTADVYSMWYKIYQGIKNANSFMEAVADSRYDENGRYYNEARFLRAYYHFILAQAWGDVPLRDKMVSDYAQAPCAASSQYKVLSWAAREMEACVDFYEELYWKNIEYQKEDQDMAPSRISKNTVHGILARVYLFMAGESVTLEGEDTSGSCYAKAMSHAKAVIDSEVHQLNPDYSQIFINMISDKYDREFCEPIWEVEFRGDRTSADFWSNGYIGSTLGLESGGAKTNYSDFNCNFAYGKYNGSLKLWDLYWKADRTDDETESKEITDERQQWNLPPYNYEVDGVNKHYYKYQKADTQTDPLAAQAVRNCGKFRREVIYEGQKSSKGTRTSINFPLLRYADVLLMYAEASNEINGVTPEAYNAVKSVRDRAGIKTRVASSYDQDSFRELIRNERGRELCFESLRRYDLIRWGIYVQEMQNYKYWVQDDRWARNTDMALFASRMGGNVKPMHIFLPIPSVELGVNDLLEQNPLW